MKNSDFPSNNDLTEAILAALEQLGGEAKTGAINKKVVELLHLPKEIVELEHPDGLCTLLDYKLRWARTSLKDQIENTSRGVWKLKKTIDR